MQHNKIKIFLQFCQTWCKLESKWPRFWETDLTCRWHLLDDKDQQTNRHVIAVPSSYLFIAWSFHSHWELEVMSHSARITHCSMWWSNSNLQRTTIYRHRILSFLRAPKQNCWCLGTSCWLCFNANTFPCWFFEGARSIKNFAPCERGRKKQKNVFIFFREGVGTEKS